MTSSKQEWVLVAGLVTSALIVGWITDAYGWAMCIAVLVYAALLRHELTVFTRWAQRPLGHPANRLGSWQLPVESLFRTIRRSRSRVRRSLQQLRALRAVADAIPDAAIIVDASGHIETFNAAAVDLLNFEPSHHGANMAMLIRQPDVVALVRGDIDDEIIEFPSPFDSERRLEARRVVLEHSRALVLVRDVTQLNRLLSMRQDFIANVSHELRTPLTVIVGYLESLMDETLDRETTATLVEKLQSPARRMQALVNDLLLLTRLEASPAPEEHELQPLSMSALIDSVIAEARALSGGAHQITAHVESDRRVLGIENELHSACSNLVCNAVRYSPDGGAIDVTWSNSATGARFAVRDRGLGIPHEHLSRLTERFYRVDLAKSRVRGGTGLGLAIVKHVLKRHNTKLEIDSRLGEGSTFYCDFPDARIAEPEIPTTDHQSTTENQ